MTTFLYFGPLSLDLLFHVFFLQRYSRLLEESSGRSPAHYSWLLLYATTTLLCLSPLLSIHFLGSALSSSLVYIWSRRNRDTRLSFLGLLVFTAPYLPWVLMAFSWVLHGKIPNDEICGVIVGHGMWFFPTLKSLYRRDLLIKGAFSVWYFFNDVYPPLHNGSRPFDPPRWWTRIFEGPPAESDETPIDNDIVAAAAPEVR